MVLWGTTSVDKPHDSSIHLYGTYIYRHIFWQIAKLYIYNIYTYIYNIYDRVSNFNPFFLKVCFWWVQIPNLQTWTLRGELRSSSRASGCKHCSSSTGGRGFSSGSRVGWVILNCTAELWVAAIRINFLKKVGLHRARKSYLVIF